MISQKHLNRVIELGLKENTPVLLSPNGIIARANKSQTVNEGAVKPMFPLLLGFPTDDRIFLNGMKENESPHYNPTTAIFENTHSPELLTFFTETIQLMERNIQILSIQNELIKRQNTKLLQKTKHGIKENAKDKIEQTLKESMQEKTQGIERITGANKSQIVDEGWGRRGNLGFPTDDRIFRNGMTENVKTHDKEKKVIDYFNSKHKDAVDISTFYNQERGVSFTESQMNIERILKIDIITLVYEWFCMKIETVDKYKLPLQVHNKITYIKIDDEWRKDNGEKEESFLETFLLPFYDFLIKTNEDVNITEQEKTMIERVITKYMCMSKETKDKILKKIFKHPKIVCNAKV
jgi:hypothetical protein